MRSVHRIVCVLWTMLVATIPGMGQEVSQFQFTRPIEVELHDQEELFAASLDSDVYASTRDGFPDLQVLDSENRVVPFLIRRVAENRSETVQRFWTAQNRSLKPLNSDGLEIRIVLSPEDPAPAGLRFVTPLKNFEQQVQVFATTNGTESTLVEGAVIFDYSQFMDVRRTEIPFPQTSAREFRIVINPVTLVQESQLLELTRSLQGGSESSRTETTLIERRPFRIDQIDLWTEQVAQTQQSSVVQSWPVADLKVSADIQQKQTLIEFSSRREPLTELTLITSSTNFSRHVAVQVESESGSRSGDWNAIAEATVSQFQLRNFQEQHLKIPLPETRTDRFRLVLDNRDSAELSIEGISAAGHQYEVIFLGRPGESFQLVYGSASAEPPEQDLVALTTALARDIRPLPATLGAPSKRKESEAREPMTIKDLLNNQLALGTVIGILVIVLGWGLYQASRRIDRMPP